MDHAAAQNLNPAFALAQAAAFAVAAEALDIHLGGRLGEGEVMGTEPHHSILTIQPLDKGFQAAFQVSHGDALVHHQTLDLMEQRGSGWHPQRRSGKPVRER